MKTKVGFDRPPRLLTLKNNWRERRMKGKLIHWIGKDLWLTDCSRLIKDRDLVFIVYGTLLYLKSYWRIIQWQVDFFTDVNFRTVYLILQFSKTDQISTDQSLLLSCRELRKRLNRGSLEAIYHLRMTVRNRRITRPIGDLDFPSALLLRSSVFGGFELRGSSQYLQ